MKPMRGRRRCLNDSFCGVSAQRDLWPPSSTPSFSNGWQIEKMTETQRFYLIKYIHTKGCCLLQCVHVRVATCMQRFPVRECGQIFQSRTPQRPDEAGAPGAALAKICILKKFHQHTFQSETVSQLWFVPKGGFRSVAWRVDQEY